MILWTLHSHRDLEDVYGVKVSRDLKTISSPIPIAGIRDYITSNRAKHPNQSNISYSNNQALIIWPSRDGYADGTDGIEGWYIDVNTFK